MCEVFSKEYTVSEKLKSYLEENIPYLEQIMWQGGEVFLYNQFDKLMELAHKYNVNQNIVTNGLLMNEERIKKLSKYNLNLKISIDAVDKETYEQIRVGGKFETLVENLEILKKYKDAGANFKCELGAVIINKNYEKIDDIVNFAIKYGFENIIFQKYTPYRDKTLSLSDEQQIFVFNKIEMLKQKYETSTTNLRICSDIVLDTKEEKKNTEGNNKNLTENKDSYQNWNYHIDKNFIYDDVDTISVNKESSLFCFAPWSILYMLMNDEVAFSCRCKPIKSFEYENEDIWNCKKIQKYRENIIKNNLFECNICKGFGDNFKYSKYGML